MHDLQNIWAWLKGLRGIPPSGVRNTFQLY